MSVTHDEAPAAEAIATIAAEVRGRGADRLPRALAALDAGRRAGLHLGAQLYASLGGETVADLALGEARPGETMTPDHLMLWLSSTKPVTAVAVAQLWEHGLLELDDPVAQHLPEFAAGGKDAVTVRHVLTHTGGFRMAGVDWPEAGWDEVVDEVCRRKLEPRWVPGEKAGYHQAGSWFVLGELVRRLDGREFHRYVREEVFAPIGADDAWIGMPGDRHRAYRDAGRLAPMYATEADRDGRRPPRPTGADGELRVVRPSPGGNGWGPMRALGRFYETLLFGGRPPGGAAASRILSPQAVEAFTARHRVGMFDHTFQHVMDWGLGFICDSKQYGADTVPYAYGTLCSRRTFGHSGYRSSTGFADPRHRLVVALGMNGLPEAGVHERRVREVLDALYRDLGLGHDGGGDRGDREGRR
jgi:CubicO group peptidase (beta-lactamase class C family)